MIEIDGSTGEGGGQILRTALALATVTGTAFRMESIRSKRKKPGLMRQHLTCVQAAAEICGAEVVGAEIGSGTVTFQPGMMRAGHYKFAIGTAGSTTLVLQTVMWGLLHADGPSEVVLEGGTHNPLAPPFDFLERAFLPLLARMGGRVSVRLDKAGFYPAGGGRIIAQIEPGTLTPLALDYSPPKTKRAVAMFANLPADIAKRELAVIRERLGIDGSIHEIKRSAGPGNTITIDVESDGVTEVFTGFGERGVKAEDVANAVADEVDEYLKSQVPVGRYLADQLILPMALAGGGRFKTLPLSEHANTQLKTVSLFLDIAGIALTTP